MHAIKVVIGVGWLVFLVGWLLAARNSKSGRTRWARFTGFRIATAVLIVVLEKVPAFRHSYNHDPVVGIVGLVLFVLGLMVAVWARRHLGRNWGIPMSEKNEPELVTSGPYRWIRNPIYSGLILALIGTSIAVSVGWLVVVVAISGYFIYSAIVEQRIMAAQCPETYPAYRASTKMLIPYVF